MLNDRQLFDLLKGRPTTISGYTPPTTLHEAVTSESALQPSSFDLKVGAIYIPDVGPDDPGGVTKPLTSHSLKPGHTAVVESAEVLDLPKDVAAFGFPPSRLSVRGLLMTNPGHVDPGYNGKLRFTVINMGKNDLPLDGKQAIVTLLFFRIESVARGYAEINGPGAGVKYEDLERLSRDFLNIEKRAKRAARSYGLSLRFLALVIPLAATLIVSYVSLVRSGEAAEAEITILKAQVAQLQQSPSVAELDRRVHALELKKH